MNRETPCDWENAHMIQADQIHAVTIVDLVWMRIQ